MKLRKFPSLLLILVISLQLFALPQTCDSNPIVVNDTNVGGIYANCSHVQLPEADVNIHVKYLGASIFDVSVSCRFTIYSNITQTSMLAFAYPKSWIEDYPPNQNETFDILLFDIEFDGKTIETWNFEWKDAVWVNEVDDKWDILAVQPAYVGFNVELESYTNHTLDVMTSFRRTTVRDDFSLSYIYASAQTFEGYVDETITMEIEELVPLAKIQFSSQQNMITRIENQVTTATWNLHFDQAPGYYVFTWLTIDENETYYGQAFNSFELLIIGASISSIIIVVVLVLRKFSVKL